ncbi:hypothetical protein WOLCODRAFT_15209 [Wolfiporia cocos MD-104 SS10]|uniref:Uncharacterized protein n=1 Tax=Wolfiporia cocos (strain MD-104) TaxID=742152 RepID=A0A2H3J9C1_WOLCO|nr:hypothetical protein WOLCODRAFT_15209 [Wolfiporia cocos MD-104 SS10]
MSVTKSWQRLSELQSLIDSLPSSLPHGTSEGPIARYFSDLSVDPDEGPYYSVDWAWTHVFQVSEHSKIKLVCRGEYGLQLIHNFLAYFITVPGIEKDNGLQLLEDRIGSLIDLITHVKAAFTAAQQASIDSDAAFATADAATSKSHVAVNNTVPSKKQLMDSTAKKPSIVGKILNKPSEPHVIFNSSTDNESDVPEVNKKAGRCPIKAEWALAQFEPLAATHKSQPIWKWRCNWTFRTSPQTPKCREYAQETLKAPVSSNFISHLEKCEGLPADQTFAAWSSRKNGQLGDGLITEMHSQGGRQAQTRFMLEFTKQGADNPEKQLNKVMQENPSKIAVASDLWTSKNSVYAFAGTVAFWIDDNWDLIEHVLELLPLDGDHSGAASAKLIFNALHRRKVTDKLRNIHASCILVASTADNAASNSTMNHTLSTMIQKKHGILLDPQEIQSRPSSTPRPD